MALIRSALVTGASSGIGAEFARALAARGCDVTLVARRVERLDALAVKLAGDYGVRADVHAADLADPGALAEVEARLAGDPPIDLLVNNAGMGDGGTSAEMPADDQERVVRLNVIAPVRLARAIAPGLLDRGCGGVINVSSLTAMLPGQPDGGAYAASKAFLVSYGESLAAEFAGRGPRVTTVCPGWARTEMTAGLQERGLPAVAWVPVERVVAGALRAFAAGRRLVVPGGQYKAADALLRLLPRPALRAVLRRGAAMTR